MKNKFIILILFFVSIKIVAQDASLQYAQTITAEELKKHLTYIASDELEGRDTGSEGQRKAAEYIANHFKNLGLLPIVPQKDGTKDYFQRFNLYKKGWKESYVVVNGKKKIFFKDYYPNGLVNVPDEKTTELMYVGFGIQNTHRDDYKTVDVKNKAVLFFEGDPTKSESESSTWEGTSGFTQKINTAKVNGASMVFMITAESKEKFQTLAAERRAVLSRFNRVVMEPSTGEKPTEMPSFIVSIEMAAEMLGISEKKLLELKSEAERIKKSSTITIKAERGDELLETMNIMGFLEGTDKKEEVIVLTAHYDHVGIDNKGQIYNGADDDGSGTCSILELAEAFVKAKNEGNAPRRSILFMTVTGEEKGLLGSKYFTDIDPIIPLKNIVCDLNIDMIGRIDKAHASNEKYVYVIGSDKLSSELHEISKATNEKYINYALDYTFNDPKDPNRFYYRSDHYNFAKNQIPVIFYFTGVHEDYHQPGDDVEKIMFPKYEQIVRLVFHTAWELTQRNERIKVDSNKP